MSTSISKMRKLNDGKRISSDSGEDRISSLPNDTIYHILSFLDTKAAVATGVLSSQWKDLWLPVPFIETESPMSSTIVRRRGRRINGTYYLDKLLTAKFTNGYKLLKAAVWLEPPVDFSRLRQAIDTVMINCKVQELGLKVNGLVASFPFPFCLCTSLTILKIDMNSTLHCPSDLYFAKLKILCLINVKFYCEDDQLNSDLPTQEKNDEVAFEFPTLEEFNLCTFQLVNIKRLNITAPNLKSLSVNDTESDIYDLGCKINIDAPSLLSFQMESNCLPSVYSLGELTSLKKAAFNVYQHAEPTHVDGLLRALTSMNDLELSVSDHLFEALSIAEDQNHPLRFPRVTKLTLIAKDDFQFDNLIELLDKVPNLESLVIIKGTCILLSKTAKRKCPLLHLKSIRLNVFGHSYDRYLLEFFLKEAMVLENVIVVLPLDPNKHTRVKKVLQRLPMNSSKCIMQFQV